MATKTTRLDVEVIEALRLKSNGRNLNDALRNILGLPEKKHRKGKLAQDHLSKAKRSIKRALEELEAMGVLK